MKIFVAVILAVLLAGCEPQQPIQVSYIMPAELSDCKVHKIDSTGGPILYVVRCSGQKATEKPTETAVDWKVTSGKTTNYYHTILIDGVEYQKVEK